MTNFDLDKIYSPVTLDDLNELEEDGFPDPEGYVLGQENMEDGAENDDDDDDGFDDFEAYEPDFDYDGH